MSDLGKPRLVYSTGLGSICQGCGWPDNACKCSSQRAPSAAIPTRIVAKLRMEKKGRGGKTVTVVAGLNLDDAALAALSRRLKAACGTGGTVKDRTLEFQGDHRDQLIALLTREGFETRRAGG